MKKPYRRAFIELTNACNLECGFCARSKRPVQPMPLPLFVSTAAQAGELAEMLSLHLLGEPLTHQEFPAALAACSGMGLNVNLVTNGLLLGNFPPSLFKEPCLAQVSISLHALACLPAELRAAELEKLAAFALAKPEGLTIGFRLRSSEEDSFYKETLKALMGHFKATMTPGADFVKLAEKVFLNFGGVFNWPGGACAAAKPKAGCLGLRHHFGVLSDGRVVPCCADYDGAMALGNIKERPLADILAGAEAAALKAALSGGAPMPAYCASCGFTAPDAE